MKVLFIVLIVLAVMLCLPICVDVRYIDEEFSYKITYAFIKLLPKNNKKKVKKSKKSKQPTDAKKENSTKTDKKSKGKDSENKALDTLSLVLDIFKAIKDDLGKFITSVRITDLYINFQVADLDAYECALKFGKLNIALGNVLGILEWNFKVKKKSITIVPKYNSDESVYNVSFKVKLGLGRGLWKIIVILFKALPSIKRHNSFSEKIT